VTDFLAIGFPMGVRQLPLRRLSRRRFVCALFAAAMPVGATHQIIVRPVRESGLWKREWAVENCRHFLR
jgi:hypothetical protein